MIDEEDERAKDNSGGPSAATLRDEMGRSTRRTTKYDADDNKTIQEGGESSSPQSKRTMTLPLNPPQSLLYPSSIATVTSTATRCDKTEAIVEEDEKVKEE